MPVNEWLSPNFLTRTMQQTYNLQRRSLTQPHTAISKLFFAGKPRPPTLLVQHQQRCYNLNCINTWGRNCEGFAAIHLHTILFHVLVPVRVCNLTRLVVLFCHCSWMNSDLNLMELGKNAHHSRKLKPKTQTEQVRKRTALNQKKRWENIKNTSHCPVCSSGSSGFLTAFPTPAGFLSTLAFAALLTLAFAFGEALAFIEGFFLTIGSWSSGSGIPAPSSTSHPAGSVATSVDFTPDLDLAFALLAVLGLAAGVSVLFFFFSTSGTSEASPGRLVPWACQQKEKYYRILTLSQQNKWQLISSPNCQQGSPRLESPLARCHWVHWHLLESVPSTLTQKTITKRNGLLCGSHTLRLKSKSNLCRRIQLY